MDCNPEWQAKMNSVLPEFLFVRIWMCMLCMDIMHMYITVTEMKLEYFPCLQQESDLVSWIALPVASGLPGWLLIFLFFL